MTLRAGRTAAASPPSADPSFRLRFLSEAQEVVRGVPGRLGPIFFCCGCAPGAYLSPPLLLPQLLLLRLLLLLLSRHRCLRDW